VFQGQVSVSCLQSGDLSRHDQVGLRWLDGTVDGRSRQMCGCKVDVRMKTWRCTQPLVGEGFPTLITNDTDINLNMYDSCRSTLGLFG